MAQTGEEASDLWLKPEKRQMRDADGLESGIGAKKMAPAAGFEPATKWLTATYSTAELCRSVSTFLKIIQIPQKANRNRKKNELFRSN